MATDAQLRAAECKAEELIRGLGIGALPTCPFQIAQAHGITVTPKDTDEPGVSGFLMRVGDAFGIVYANHIGSEGFVRFTVAHELGHYFLPGHPHQLFPDGDGVHASQSGFFGGNDLEKEADHFAAGLLMPKQLFLPVLRDSGEGFVAIRKLAATCRTSLTATAIRFAQFAEDPVAVVVSTAGVVDFCSLSKCLRSIQGMDCLRKGQPVPRGTRTAKFGLDSESIRQGKEDAAYASLDDWFDGAPEMEAKEDIVGLGRYRKTLTVLFSSEPIPDEDDD